MTAIKAQAIQTALMGDWENAITLNRQLLKENPQDIDTLNRLAFAFCVLGKIKEAKGTYQKVLNIDKKNPIALKNLKKLSGFQPLPGDKGKKDKKGMLQIFTHANNLFLEESGKTKIVELVNVAQPKVISSILTGEQLLLRVKRLKVFVLDEKNRYVGMLPDNIAKRLIVFIKGGNSYEAYVKSIQNNHVSVFIKETKRTNKFKNQPSFTLGEKGKIKMEKFAKPASEKENEDQEEDED